MASILLITSDFPPLNNIASRRMFAFAKYLRRAGHTISVVTPRKCYFEEEMNFDVDTSEFSVTETAFPNLRAFLHRAFRVRGYADLVGAEKGGKGCLHAFVDRALKFCHERSVLLGTLRMPNFLDLWIPSAVRDAQRVIRGRAVDVMITSYSPPAAHLAGYLLKKRFPGLVWIGDYRDAWTRNDFRHGLPCFRILEGRLEKACVRAMDAATVATETIGKDLAAWWKGRVIEVIENGYDEELFEAPASGEHKKDSVFRIVFAGTLYSQRNAPELFFQALGELLARGSSLAGRLEVTFFGNRHTKSMIGSLLARYPLDGIVRYGGMLSPRQIGKEMMGADALLFFENDARDDGVLTGKIFEYMYVRKPVICIGVDRGSSIGEFLNRTGLAFLCGRSVERIQECIMSLMSGDLAVRPNEEFIRLYSRERRVEELNVVIDACMERYGRGRPRVSAGEGSAGKGDLPPASR